jgi:hypothetical protein
MVISTTLGECLSCRGASGRVLLYLVSSAGKCLCEQLLVIICCSMLSYSVCVAKYGTRNNRIESMFALMPEVRSMAIERFRVATQFVFHNNMLTL